MLGFGDVILPSLLVGYMLAFDILLLRHTPVAARPSAFPLRYAYWTVAVTAYATGLILTFLVMAVTRRPQPALLYLVPWCALQPPLLFCEGIMAAHPMAAPSAARWARPGPLGGGAASCRASCADVFRALTPSPRKRAANPPPPVRASFLGNARFEIARHRRRTEPFVMRVAEAAGASQPKTELSADLSDSDEETEDHSMQLLP